MLIRSNRTLSRLRHGRIKITVSSAKSDAVFGGAFSQATLSKAGSVPPSVMLRVSATVNFTCQSPVGSTGSKFILCYVTDTTKTLHTSKLCSLSYILVIY